MAQIRTNKFEGFIKEFEARSDDPIEVLKELQDLLSKFKVVKLIHGWHISDIRSFYDSIAEGLGDTQNIAEDYAQGGAQTGERWMEIRYDEEIPDLAAFRHSKNAQPLHTDESYIADPCDIMVFYCQNRAPSGGETLFVDGLDLVNRMQDVDPVLLDDLATCELLYEKAGNKRKAKIIDLSDSENPVLNFNYYCISPNESEENKALNQRFLDFLYVHVRGAFIEKPVGLRPGEGVFWWDHYVLHGRNPFDAKKTDDRFIWKTGVRL